MLLIDIYRYLKRRADKRPVYLKNFVDQRHHHGTRTEEPSVSIIIPTRDKVELLQACIESVINKTSYKNYEIVIVDNQSADPKTLQYLDDLTVRGVRILKYDQKFNYSAICNLASSCSEAELLCFLNNDTEIISPDWLTSMVDHAKHPEVGLVGSLLLYPDGTIQHAGVALGHTGVAGHAGNGAFVTEFFDDADKNKCFAVSGATFACAAIRRDIFLEIGGLDRDFPVGLNDVDLSLRLMRMGLINVLCTSSNLIHHESMTRKSVTSPKGFVQAVKDVVKLLKMYSGSVKCDRYFWY